MSAPYLERVDDLSAWRRADLGDLSEVSFHLSDVHVAELDEALQAALRAGHDLASLTREHFPLPTLAAEFSSLYQNLQRGHGIVFIRGVPVARYTLPELELLYWGIGTWFGMGVSQSVMGDRIGHVTDVSGKDPNERAYRNSLAIPPHTDLADIVGMLSVRRAAEGGLSTYTSVTAIHNEILRTRPECLAPLYRGYRMHRFGEQPPGEPPVTAHPVPVLAERDGLVSARIVPEYIDMAEVELGEPMAAADRAALDCFLALADHPDLRLDVMLEPGDLSFINNYTVLHSRTAFEDDPALFESGFGRLLLRLWLIAPDRRPVPDDFARAEGDGISAQAGRESTYFDGEAAAAAHRERSYQD